MGVPALSWNVPGRVGELQSVEKIAYSVPVVAAAAAGICTPQTERQGAHPMWCLFLCPQFFMAGRFRHLRVAAPRCGSANLFRPATFCRFAPAVVGLSTVTEASAMTRKQNRLIPFRQRFIAGVPTRVVSARTLHGFLQSKQHFTSWIRNRVHKWRFLAGEDFLITLLKTPGGRPRKEYWLTLDMAKMLAMAENCPMGDKARRYFIACEAELMGLRKAKALPAPKPAEPRAVLGDDDKYRMLNAMVKQMGFRKLPMVVSFLDLAHLVGLLRDLQASSRRMEATRKAVDEVIDRLKNLTGTQLAELDEGGRG